jgi:hypothetical protein
MKQIAALSLAVLALLGSWTPGQADTKLLWRTPTSGATVITNSQGTLVTLGQAAVSAYEGVRSADAARRPATTPLTSPFGSAFRIELRISERSENLGLLENGILSLNPTATNAGAPARTERVTAVYDFPVITSLLIGVVGPTTGTLRTTVDVYLYGQTDVGTTSP